VVNFLSGAPGLRSHRRFWLIFSPVIILADAPDAFGSTYAEVSAHPLEIWRQQLQEIVTFVAVHDGEDVGIVRCASDE
jgi:hypothetical protein